MPIDQWWPNATRQILAFAAIVEVVTGVILIIDPAIVISLLFGADASGSSLLIGRLCGIGLLALGMACWPGKHSAGTIVPAFRAMLTYNLLVALYLFYLGATGQGQGLLLWPATGLHAFTGVALIWIRPRGAHAEA